MMILGTGIDIVELPRIERLYERHGDGFLKRICRPGEVQSRQGEALIQHLGGLFAAKEAVLKALGTGWAQGLGLRQVEVVRSDAGAPGICLHELAAERAAAMGVVRTHLSISHERSYAVAMAILEGDTAQSDATQGNVS